MNTNSVMHEAQTVEGGASKPGVREDDRPDHVGKDDDPVQEVVKSPGIHRKCVHTRKGRY